MNEWEVINPNTSRLWVPGGWLYACYSALDPEQLRNAQIVFVPHPAAQVTSAGWPQPTTPF